MNLLPKPDKKATINRVKHFFTDNDGWPQIKRLSGCQTPYFAKQRIPNVEDDDRYHRYLSFCMAYQTVQNAVGGCSKDSQIIIKSKYLPSGESIMADWKIQQVLNCEKTKYRELDAEARLEFADCLESEAFKAGVTQIIPDLHEYA